MEPGGDFESLTQQRIELEEKIGKLEQQIYSLETSYLDLTSETGNVFRGWSDYLTLRNKQPPHRKHGKAIREIDRLFSLSSITSPASKLLDSSFQQQQQQQQQLPTTAQQQQQLLQTPVSPSISLQSSSAQLPLTSIAPNLRSSSNKTPQLGRPRRVSTTVSPQPQQPSDGEGSP